MGEDTWNEYAHVIFITGTCLIYYRLEHFIHPMRVLIQVSHVLLGNQAVSTATSLGANHQCAYAKSQNAVADS